MNQATDSTTNTASSSTAQGQHYTLGYRLLHWAMAVLVLLMLFALMGFNPSTGELSDSERAEMLVGHSSIGSIIAVLLLLRIFKRFIKRDAQPVHDLAVWQKRAAKAVHLGLYLMMALVPLSGYLTANLHKLPVMAFGNFNLNPAALNNPEAYDQAAFLAMRQLHEIAIFSLISLIILHVGAVLYHRLIKKDQVLASMLRGQSKK